MLSVKAPIASSPGQPDCDLLEPSRSKSINRTRWLPIIRINRRRPAWEDDDKLETKTIAFPAPRSGDREFAGFHSVLRSVR